jgi:hypothetical protein
MHICIPAEEASFNTAILLQPDLLHTLRRFLSGQDFDERIHASMLLSRLS